MADYEDFKESLKATISGVAGIAKNIVSSAGDKAKALSRIAKLTIDLNAEKENAKKVYTEIGKLYFEINKENPGDSFIQLFAEATLLSNLIMNIEEELTALKADLGEGFEQSDSFEATVEAEECCAGTEPSIEVEITTEETPKT